MAKAKKAIGAETRAKTMAAALDIFCEEGYSGASMSKIAKAASVLPGSIYWMFDSKEDLFAEVFKHASEKWRESLSEHSSFPPKTIEGLGQLYRDVGEHQNRVPSFIQLIFVVASEASARTERTLAVVSDVRDFWRSRLASAIIENIFCEDTTRARTLAEHIANLSLSLSDAVYISAQIDDDERALSKGFFVVADVLERELRHGLAELKL